MNRRRSPRRTWGACRGLLCGGLLLPAGLAAQSPPPRILPDGSARRMARAEDPGLLPVSNAEPALPDGTAPIYRIRPAVPTAPSSTDVAGEPTPAGPLVGPASGGPVPENANRVPYGASVRDRLRMKAAPSAAPTTPATPTPAEPRPAPAAPTSIEPRPFPAEVHRSNGGQSLEPPPVTAPTPAEPFRPAIVAPPALAAPSSEPSARRGAMAVPQEMPIPRTIVPTATMPAPPPQFPRNPTWGMVETPVRTPEPAGRLPEEPRRLQSSYEPVGELMAASDEWGRSVREGAPPADAKAASGPDPLEVRNIAFCWKVDGFGTYDPLPEAKFRPGQELLAYIEIDRFASEWTQQGYRTITETSCRIIDAQGETVASRRFPTAVDLCRSRRRDFFQTLRFRMPNDLMPGDYRIELFVTDRIRRETARGVVPFRLLPPQLARGHGPAPTPAPPQNPDVPVAP